MKDKELMAEAMKWAKLLPYHPAKTICRLVERVEELTAGFPAPKSIVWEPKKGEEYWYVDFDGTGQACRCFWDDYSIDLNRLKHHNVYKTQVQAEKAAKYQQRYNMVLQAVLNLEPDQNIYWNDMNQVKYGVEFNNKSGRWLVVDYTFIDGGYPPLTDQKNVQPLLDYLNSKEKSDGSYKL